MMPLKANKSHNGIWKPDHIKVPRSIPQPEPGLERWRNKTPTLHLLSWGGVYMMKLTLVGGWRKLTFEGPKVPKKKRAVVSLDCVCLSGKYTCPHSCVRLCVCVRVCVCVWVCGCVCVCGEVFSCLWTSVSCVK